MSVFDTNKWVGKRIPRKEDPRLLTGRGHFVADMHLPGMVEAAFVRSHLAHGSIEGLDTDAAQRHAGVLAVYTWDDIADTVAPMVAECDHPGYFACPYHPLASQVVRWVGEPIAAVVAVDRYTAEDATELIGVELEELPPVTNIDSALRDDAPQLHASVPNNTYNSFATADKGDVAATISRCEHRLELTLESQRVAPLPLEPRAILADATSGDGELTVWVTHQAPHLFRTGVSRALGIPESRIRVISPDVGGGFGSKLTVYPEDLVVCEAARRLGRPVRWVSDRREDLMTSMHGREQRHKIEVGFDDDGSIRAVGVEIWADNGANAPWPYTAALDSGQASESVTGPYEIDAYERRVHAVATNKPPMGPYRGVGRVMACFTMECAVDEVAHRLGLEPLDVRERNIVRSYPFRTPVGQEFASGSSLESIQVMREHLDLPELRRSHREARARGEYLGVGFAAGVEPNSMGPQAMAKRGIDIGLGYESGSVRVEPDGMVTVLAGTHGHGQGHETALGQLAADALGVDLDAVSVRFGDTAVVPYGFGTWASRSMVYGGGAVLQAANDVRIKAVAVAAAAMEAAPEDCVYQNGSVSVAGSPGAAMTLAEIAKVAYHQGHRLPEDLDPGLEATRRYRGPEPGCFSNALHGAEVRVDATTGLVELLRFVVVEDCGVMINPLLVDGQVHGGVAQGIGHALLEEIPYDEYGQPLATTLIDYLVPSAWDVPPIDTIHLESPSPHTMGAVKGMGEGGAINSPAAIANAVTEALQPFGVRVHRTPISPRWLLQQIHESNAGPMNQTLG